MKILKFGTESCSQCRMQEIELMNNKVIFTSIDLEKDSKSQYYIDKYHITNIPIVVIQDDNDNDLNVYRGFTRVSSIKELKF